MGTRITSTGHYLPSLSARGGVTRPLALEAVGPSVLAQQATEVALRRAQLEPAALDYLIAATMTPDVCFPGLGCFLQQHLDRPGIGALDIRGQCAGFLYGLAIADRYLQAGAYSTILVAGAEVHSAGLDYSDAGLETAQLFGDGAGVMLLQSQPEATSIHALTLHSDGRQAERFWCEYPASRQHPTRMRAEDFRAGRHFPTIDIPAVAEFGQTVLPAVIRETLDAAQMSLGAVDRFIIGHLLPDVAAAVGPALGVPSAQINVPAARYGHLSAAAVPVALSEEIAAGTLGPGATVCLAAAGAGWTWGAALITL